MRILPKQGSGVIIILFHGVKLPQSTFKMHLLIELCRRDNVRHFDRQYSRMALDSMTQWAPA